MTLVSLPLVPLDRGLAVLGVTAAVFSICTFVFLCVLYTLVPHDHMLAGQCTCVTDHYHPCWSCWRNPTGGTFEHTIQLVRNLKAESKKA